MVVEAVDTVEFQIAVRAWDLVVLLPWTIVAKTGRTSVLAAVLPSLVISLVALVTPCKTERINQIKSNVVSTATKNHEFCTPLTVCKLEETGQTRQQIEVVVVVVQDDPFLSWRTIINEAV